MRELRQNWLDIFRAFRIAVDPRKLMLGFVGALVSLAIVILLLLAFTPIFPNGITRVADVILEPGAESITALWNSVVSRLMYLGWKEAGFLILTGAILCIIWSFFGGAIIRSAAVEFARDETVGLEESTKFARRKLWSCFWAPIVPWIIIAVILLCIYVGGLVGRIPYLGPLLVGIFFFLALIAGFLALALGIAAAAGCMLMWPTIATEGSDAFDAISRAFSYVYSRPWKLIGYVLVGLAYGLVCLAFVVIFAYLWLQISIAPGAAGMGEAFEPIRNVIAGPVKVTPEIVAEGAKAAPNIAQKICGILMKAAIVLVWGLVVGFALSMCMTLDTIIYSLLRKSVDGTDMTEVYIEEEEEESPLPPTAEAPKKEEAAQPEEEKEEEGGEEEKEQ